MGRITGHGHLRKHLHRVGILREDPLCRICDEQEETAERLLFDCPSITREATVGHNRRLVGLMVYVRGAQKALGGLRATGRPLEKEETEDLKVNMDKE
ncbi:hypothetical protein J6590_020701 [Homalodisca vitripennis]|nr:hypothetical protein J6590_020701 [Homalodisca vitripennis]